MTAPSTAQILLNKLRWRTKDLALAYPRRVECNVCGWRARRFLSDEWHKHVVCFRCKSQVRHRLLVAALTQLDGVRLSDLADRKRILHFAPERRLADLLRPRAADYRSADFSRDGVDLRLDLTDMPSIPDASVDLLVACDVLEHVPDHRKALAEIHRVLAPAGWAVLTVPQKDGLAVTFEDPGITAPEERTRAYGQHDHLRIFGDDFPAMLEAAGFAARVIAADSFPPELVKRHVLFPPVLSDNPLATNHRKVFFAHKA